MQEVEQTLRDIAVMEDQLPSDRFIEVMTVSTHNYRPHPQLDSPPTNISHTHLLSKHPFLNHTYYYYQSLLCPSQNQNYYN